MRLIPRSLFGRLTLVLLTGLILTVLLSAWVQMRDRGRLQHGGRQRPGQQYRLGGSDGCQTQAVAAPLNDRRYSTRA